MRVQLARLNAGGIGMCRKRRGGSVGEGKRRVGVVDQSDGGDTHEGAIAALDLPANNKYMASKTTLTLSSFISPLQQGIIIERRRTLRFKLPSTSA